MAGPPVRRTGPAVPPGTHPVPAQPVQPAASAVTFEQLCYELDCEFKAFRRSVASYNAVYGALLHVQGKDPIGSRSRGLPIFEFPATFDGTDSVGCAINLAHLQPEEAAMVLTPLVNLSVADADSALATMASKIAALQAYVANAKPEEAGT